MATIECVECSTAFQGRSNQKVCSDKCRKAYRAKYMREYFREQHEKTGMWPGKRYSGVRRDCEWCGKEFLTSSKTTRTCSAECSNWIKPTTAKVCHLRVIEEKAPSSPRQARFVSFKCTWCGEWCVGDRSAFWNLQNEPTCSSRCLKKKSKAKSKGFQVPDSVRNAIYERDSWVCQICGDPTSRTYDHNDPKSPTLDHIIPRSKGGSDSVDNLRLAHALCNSLRGAE